MLQAKLTNQLIGGIARFRIADDMVQTFDVKDVLALLSRLPVGNQGRQGAHQLSEFIAGETLHHGIAGLHHRDFVNWIRFQYPELASVGTQLDKGNQGVWLAEQLSRFGQSIEIFRMPLGLRPGPYQNRESLAVFFGLS
jgi:hypothetical protein